MNTTVTSTSNYFVQLVRCGTCGRETRPTYVLDFAAGRTYTACSYCQHPLTDPAEPPSQEQSS